MAKSFSDRVLARLAVAEEREINPQFQEDHRIAWITVYHAALGARQPLVEAFYAVLGLHPAKAWPAIVARRKAQLGRLYSLWYDEAGLLRPANWSEFLEEAVLPPKKPSQSVRLPLDRAQARRRGGL